MIERLAHDGAFTITNGYSEFPSRTLKILFLVNGPLGLVSQYPSGTAVLAAPFFLIGGLQGVVILNAIAAVALLAVTYALALRTTGTNRSLALDSALILGLSSFLVAYAVGIWPHAIGTLLTTAPSLLLITREGKSTKKVVAVFFAGVILGLATQIRVDVIIAAAAYVAYLLFVSERPYRDAATFSIGLVPGFAISIVANYTKFGTLSPISYGHSTLGSDYIVLIPAAIAIAILVAAAGLVPVRTFIARRPLAILGTVLFVVTVFSLFSALPSRFFRGLYVLLVNMQAYDGDLGIAGYRLEGGLILWGAMIKKALFESLPWAGFLAIPLYTIVVKSPRLPIHILGFLMMGAYFAFFAPNQWHGGQAPNMRYFLPTLPFMAILAAAGWQQLRHDSRGPEAAHTVSTRAAIALLALGVGVLFAVAHIPVTLVDIAVASGIQRGLFFFSLALAIAWLALPRYARWIRPAATVVFAYGIVAAGATGYRHDLVLMEKRRVDAVDRNKQIINLKAGALVVTPWPRFYQRVLLATDGAVAIHLRDTNDFDYGLISEALARGRPVYVTDFAARDMRRDPASENYVIDRIRNADEEIYRITARAPARLHAPRN
jgi:hypothetical protein